MSLSPDWMPVSLSIDVPPGTTAPVVIGGEEVVIWRSITGTIHAWLDRCPHRGMRLSLGFVRGETLACLYHGWRFNSDGACAAIPAHPDLVPPSTIRVGALETHEADGLVWMRQQQGSDMNASGGPPRLPARTVPVRSLTIDTSVGRVRAALLAEGRSLGEHLIVHEPENAEGRLAVALLPVIESRTVLFVLRLAKIGEMPALDRAAAWAVALRQTLESP